MPRTTLATVQAWVEATKFTIPDITTSPNVDLIAQIEAETLARVHSVYDTSTWIDAASTPYLIQVAIAKRFVAWAYRRQYSESITDTDAKYAELLEANAESIVAGIVDGTIEIPTLPSPATSQPGFYPNDDSSALEPTFDDPSLGPAKFSMGIVF